MNCSRFRFLIQQRFDMDIAPQDERMVGAHLESCESCAKFHHQLQQVIMAAEEVPLPDEMSPSPPEALARNIMEGLPQPKSSPFAFISKLFAKKEKELPTTIDRGGDRSGSPTKFPHVNRGAQAGDGMGMDAPRKEMAMPTGKQKEEDHSGTSNRLRALAKGPAENREAQSTTRSLGEKLGFAAPPGGSLTDDQPLTLAESIRRKISEKPPEAEEEEMTMAPPVPPQPAAVDDSWGNPASTPSRAPANMASPPNIPGNRPQPAQISTPGQPEGQTVLGSWGKPSPIESSNSWGGQQSAAAQSMSKDDWNFDANANQGAPQMAPQARGGSIDPFAAPGQATSNPNMQAPSADSWGGWNDASAPKGAGASAGEGDSDWGPPPAGGAWDEPSGSSAPSNSWGGAPTQTPAQKPLSAAQAQAQFGSGVMETGMIKLGELGLPSMPGQQPAGPGGAPQQAAAQAFPQQQAQAPGTAADTSSPWGAAPSTPSAPQGGAGDPWGSSSSDSWGPATSQNAWGTSSSPENQIPAGAGNQWGQPPGQPAQAADPFGGGGAPAGDWGEPAGAPTDSWSGGAPSQGNWSQPASMPGGSWDQPGSDASQPAWGESNDWSQGAQQAPQAVPEPQQSSSQAAALGKGRQQAWSLEAEQVETGTWRAFAPSGEALSSAPAQARAPEAQTAPGANQQSFAPQQDEQSRWDIPIQERMKQSNPGLPNSPQTPVAPPSPFAQPAFNQAQAAAAAPMAPPQPQPVKPQEPLLPSDSPAPTKSGWNFPVYEAPDQLTAIPAEPKISGGWDTPVAQPNPTPSTGLGGSWGEPPAPSTPAEQPKVSGAWDMPSAPSFSQPTPVQPVQPAQPLAPMPGQPGASVPIDSIMDRLGNVLSNNADAPAQAQPSSQWDVSIQERQQQQAAAAAAAAAPQQPASPWGQLPEPAAPPAMPGNGAGAGAGGWGAPPQPLPTQPQAPTPVGSNPWDAPPAALTPPPNPFALPQQPQQAPAASGWDSPMGQSPMGQNPMSNPAQPVPLPVPQPAIAAAAAPQPAAPAQGGGLFQNLDDNAIDRLFSENLGVSDSGAAAAAAASVQQAPAPAFTAPRWNPGENGGGAPAQPSFGAPAQPSFGAPPQPFGAQPAAAADAGGPKISAITPRSAAPAEPPPMPGMDRRNQAPFAMPGAAPQTMAPPQPMASPFAQPEPAPVAAAVAPPSQKNGLFDLDDSAMDELFSKNLGVNEQATPSNQSGQPQQAAAPVFQSPPVMAQQPPTPQANPFSRPAPQMAPSMPNPFAPLSAPPAQPGPAPQQQPPQGQPAWGQQPPAPPTMQQPPQQGGLFSIDDSMIDKIFADNAAPQPPQPVAAPQFNVNEAVKEFAEVAQNVPPPKIAGVGRLDARTDTTADAGSGRIASIGKFLLDQKDLEKIGKLTGSDLSETKMRILTMEAAQELQTLLQHIGTQETVIGSVIVGHDGLLIANTMPPDIDAESMGVWALGLYMSTEMVIKKMGQDRVHQIVSRTPKGYVVIADFGGGLLVTVSDGKDTDTLIPLMRSITQLVAQ